MATSGLLHHLPHDRDKDFVESAPGIRVERHRAALVARLGEEKCTPLETSNCFLGEYYPPISTCPAKDGHRLTDGEATHLDVALVAKRASVDELYHQIARRGVRRPWRRSNLMVWWRTEWRRV